MNNTLQQNKKKIDSTVKTGCGGEVGTRGEEKGHISVRSRFEAL